MDNELTTTQNPGLPRLLETLKQVAVETNKEWAEKFGINQSVAITCNKPSGTVSQLVDSSSGIHARYAPYYIRTVRGDNKDPLTQFMKDQGIPNEPCVYKGDSTTVFSFPVKAPEGAVVTKEITAIDQLKTWLAYKEHWCEHNPSTTVNVKANEWFEVGSFVYEHFDKMTGVAFLPYDDHIYQQAPYQEITEEEYEELLSKMPEGVDWGAFSEYEKEDNTVAMQTLACSGDTCELVDVG